MTTYRARWIFPGTAPAISDGVIAIDSDGWVAWVGPAAASPRRVDHDLGDVAVVPGFVNAHTHLELGALPDDGNAAAPEDEIAWLGRVIASRADRTPAATASLIQRNLAAACAAGTTTLADLSTAGQSWAAVAGAPVWGTVFAEVLGLSAARSQATWLAATRWLAALPTPAPDDRTRAGLSPHAPYSTAAWLYHEAAATGLPLTSHLAELPEERELLAHRAGPLRRFVERLGAWDEAWQPLGPTPVDYVPAGVDCLVAHANIVEPSEFARLATDPSQPTAPRIAVVYCPRTHARFGHPPHPFRAMLAAGVVVCLGTDSLASAPTLSILDEIRFVHRRHPEIPGATLLAMATVHGAWALRRESTTGSLVPGKSADLAVLPLAPRAPAPPADPHDGWLDHDAPPLATMFRGQWQATSTDHSGPLARDDPSGNEGQS